MDVWYDWAMSTYKDWSTINLKIALNTQRGRFHRRDSRFNAERCKSEVDAIEYILAERGVPFRPVDRPTQYWRSDMMREYRNRLTTTQWHTIATLIQDVFPFLSAHIRYRLIGKTFYQYTTIAMWLFFDEFRAISHAVAKVKK